MARVAVFIWVWATAALTVACVRTDEEGVIHSGGENPFALDQLKPVRSGTHEQQDHGSSFRVHYVYGPDEVPISAWHDIPLRADGPVGQKSYHFVCEIPKGTAAKFEIHKGYERNPIAQDVKKGKLRFYKYSDSLCNYGALTQTWEDPHLIHPDTGVGGDNDPIDVLQINDTPCETGDVMSVRVLGTLALVDGDETDWKLIVVQNGDPKTDSMMDIDDVPEEKVSELREWFRNYKTAEGKGKNKFGLDEKAMPRKYAEAVVEETHESWKELLYHKDRCAPSAAGGAHECTCQFEDRSCHIARTVV